MSKPKKHSLCAYCAAINADEEDHIIARQFFPDNQKYRGNLPKIPCCGNCNCEKQKVEDISAVILQFGHNS